MSVNGKARSTIGSALAACKRHCLAAAIFSALSNLLYLAPSVYMMQVYDRVVPTGGLGTLTALSLLGTIALAFLVTFEWLRARLMLRASRRFETELAHKLIHHSLTNQKLARTDRLQIVGDFETVRQGMASPAAIALLDAPWTPIYTLVAFLLHPVLGALCLGASLLMLATAWIMERRTSETMRHAGEATMLARARLEVVTAHSAEVRALGMSHAFAALSSARRQQASDLQMEAGFTSAAFGSASRFIRLLLQSAAIGIGALLVVDNQLSAGTMIAASLLLARALAPIEQMVAGWKTCLSTRHAFLRLEQIPLPPAAETNNRLTLPAPSGALEVERVTMAAPGTNRIAIADIGFTVDAGECIGIMGPSGAGKSTLLATIAGAFRPDRGAVRFDKFAASDWDAERLARFIGYLPQNFVLFPGTIAENIARFRQHGSESEDKDAIDEQIIAAAQAAGLHERIATLPDGYDTEIGTGRNGLSAGQAQQVALARALFGSPNILILDEPTAHLDREAMQAFSALIAKLRGTGTTILFSTHSNDLLCRADKILTLAQGRVQSFAPIMEMGRPAPASRRVPRPISFPHQSQP